MHILLRTKMPAYFEMEFRHKITISALEFFSSDRIVFTTFCCKSPSINHSQRLHGLFFLLQETIKI